MSDAQRASHVNLLLLCRDHHAIVDAQPRTYSVQVLRQIKTDHEARMATRNQGRVGELTAHLVPKDSTHTVVGGLRCLVCRRLANGQPAVVVAPGHVGLDNENPSV